MSLDQVLYALLAIGFFKSLGFSLMMPIADGIIGLSTKIILALSISLPMLSNLSFQPNPQLSIYYLLIKIILNLIIGMLTGIPLLIINQAVKMYTDLVESLRGHQIGLIILILSGNEEQPLSTLFSNFLLALILTDYSLPMLLKNSACLALKSQTHIQQISLLIRNLIPTILQSLSAVVLLLLPLALLVLVIELALGIASKICSGISLTNEAYLIRFLAIYIALYFCSDQLFSSLLLVLRQMT